MSYHSRLQAKYDRDNAEVKAIWEQRRLEQEKKQQKNREEDAKPASWDICSETRNCLCPKCREESSRELAEFWDSVESTNLPSVLFNE